MNKLTFYPLGNADCCLLELSEGKKMLFDYANKRDESDDEDLRVDLPSQLREVVENSIDVVVFTHIDDDHIHKFSDLFFLDHAEKYQSSDRLKITELWVPAAVVLEQGLTGEAKTLRTEARYRLKEGKGIKVFSEPEKLNDWFKEEGIDPGNVSKLIIGAGDTVPGFDKDSEGVEFFVHSPFSKMLDKEEIDRNGAGIVLQATFRCGETETKVIMGADTTYDVWADIVRISKYYNREDRLQWDVFKISHHCSYTALSDEKRRTKTIPVDEVSWLFEQGKEGAILVSSNDPIPDGYDDDLPPHKQAANYYESVADSIDEAEFVVTMQHPNSSNPAPIVIHICEPGATLQKKEIAATAIITNRRSPKAG